MSADDRRREDPTKDLANTAASSHSVPQAPATPSPLDLSKVGAHPKTVAPASIRVRWDSAMGRATLLAADAVVNAAGKAGLKSPLPVALEIYPVPGEERALWGVPRESQSPAWLNLEWYHQGRHFRADLRQLLALLKITVPQGTRMVVGVAEENVANIGPCVKLTWDDDSFLPINVDDDDAAE